MRTPFPQRALPDDYLDAGYHRYQVLKPTSVWEGPTAPAFGQPGGGTQYFAIMNILDLVSTGFLKEIEQ